MSEVTYIIVMRNPASKKLAVIVNGEENDAQDVAEFATEDAAYECANGIAVCRSWGFEIVPVM